MSQHRFLDAVKHEWNYVDTVFCDGATEVRSYRCRKCGMSGTAKAAPDGSHGSPEVRESCAAHLLSSIMEK